MDIYGNNESLQLMQDNVPPMKYMDLLAEKAVSIRNNQLINSNDIVASFYQTMKQTNNQITALHIFDDGIERSACFLLNTLRFSQLSAGVKTNPNRIGLSKVIDCLYVEGMITREGFHAFREEASLGVMDKIATFLQHAHSGLQTSKQQLFDKWSKVFCYSSQQLWQFLHREQVSLKNYPFLFRLAELSLELSIQHIRSNYFIKFIQQGQLYFNTPECIDEQKQQEITELLMRISKQKALFIGQQYQTILPLLEQIPLRLSEVLSIDDMSLLELAGPILDRSLLGECIELSLKYLGVSSAFILHLQSASKKGRASWLKEWQLGEDNKLLILALDRLLFEEIFNIPNVKILKVYFADERREDCVQAIARYCKQSQILIFCILVKLWWKNIENTKKLGKIKLSSHALMLIAIFYLQESAQVLPIKYSSGKLSISSRNLFAQFVGFLQYYGPNGCFNKRRPRVGIYEGSEVADSNFMINLKGCSCGETKTWLSRGYPDQIDQLFSKSRVEMVSCHASRIQELFCKK